MTPDQIDLSRRLAAQERFRWMAGMAFYVRDAPRANMQLAWVSPGGELWATVTRLAAKDAGPARELFAYDQDGSYPDLDDPATVGCLLTMLWETWPEQTIGYYRRPMTDSELWWIGCHTSGATPGEATARALLAAWGG